MRADNIRRTFEALLGTDDAASRGRAFEKLLYAKLSAEGYSVHINPKAAKPRQTDLIASLDSQDFLIEAKWRQRRVDVADVDSLRARLQRTPPDFIGCIFNMSDFTATALAAVENDRTREILLFREWSPEALANFLGVQPGQLAKLGLCQRPNPNDSTFRSDIEKIAAHPGADANKLEALLLELHVGGDAEFSSGVGSSVWSVALTAVEEPAILASRRMPLVQVLKEKLRECEELVSAAEPTLKRQDWDSMSITTLNLNEELAKLSSQIEAIRQLLESISKFG